MNIKKRITIHLSASDVKEIVAKYLTDEGYKVTPNDVVLLVGTETTGYGPMEHSFPCFSECVINVKGDA